MAIGVNRPYLNARLFVHRPERQDSFAVQFVKHLRQPGVNRREATKDSFVAREVFEAGAGPGEITNGKQKEENRKRPLDAAPQPSLVSTIIVTSDRQNKP